MFDGVPDQFHQFIVSPAAAAAARTTTLPLPLPLSFPPLHNLASSNGFTSFDPLYSSNFHHHQAPPQLQQPHFLHPLHHQHQPSQKNEEKEDNTSLVGMNMEIERERSLAEPIHNHHPWSHDEFLALLRIRSSMENWFPEFTWEHVSRKLAELGFRRSAEKCKEKFEEESRYFNSINCCKNYRIFSELEQLCQASEKNKNLEKSREDKDNMGQNLEDDSRNTDHENQTSAAVNNASDQDNEKVVENKANNNKSCSNNKRKRQKKFEMIKGFCEDIVNKLMAQQEEMHNKLLEDMVKRDEEKVAREEAWKKQELDRINQELQLREKAIAGDRQATLIKLLSKFSSTSSSKKQFFGGNNGEDLVMVPNECSNLPSTSSSLMAAAQNPSLVVNNQNKVDQLSITTSTMIPSHPSSDSCPSQNNGFKATSMAENQAPQNPNLKAPTSSELAPSPQNPNSFKAQSSPLPPTSPLIGNKAPQNPTSNEKEDIGKRWPRDEVLALINLRCSLYNNGDHDKDGTAVKAPLWERISQGMLELGYKRSAKRCKEKWENINKYFRKTKDVNKKRSLDSRTCPYFHQLSTLYNQGTLIAPSEVPENHSDILPETGTGSSQRGPKDSIVHVSEGETNIVQVPALEFEF